MAIYLVQHGKALSEEEDPQRPLSEEGIKETTHMASVAEYYMLPVRKIVHSDKLRSRQTAEIFAKKLRLEEKLESDVRLSPAAQVKDFAADLTPDMNTMFVGHLPFMQKLLSLLVTGSEEHRIFAFQNSGIICLDKDNAAQEWHIKWTLSRNID
ncbi:MAG: phosphohistidine phosphatase SixA [Candidatus Rifleibacteriota bacterium]